MAQGGGKSATGRSDAEVRDALTTVAKAEKAGIKTVQLQFVDIHGVAKTKSVPVSHFQDNDEATGLLIDAISHSTAWPETLVVVIEDDKHLGTRPGKVIRMNQQ